VSANVLSGHARLADLQLAQRDRAQEHTERVAADNREHRLRPAEDARTDAAERRITELRTKAADQRDGVIAVVKHRVATRPDG